MDLGNHVGQPFEDVLSGYQSHPMSYDSRAMLVAETMQLPTRFLSLQAPGPCLRFRCALELEYQRIDG